MREYIPTLDEVRDKYADARVGIGEWTRFDESVKQAVESAYAEFDRMIAEVRRQAAEEALLKAADAFEGGEINIEIFGDSVEARLWRMSNQTRSSLVKSLRARAAAYRREETE